MRIYLIILLTINFNNVSSNINYVDSIKSICLSTKSKPFPLFIKFKDIIGKSKEVSSLFMEYYLYKDNLEFADSFKEQNSKIKRCHSICTFNYINWNFLLVNSSIRDIGLDNYHPIIFVLDKEFNRVNIVDLNYTFDVNFSVNIKVFKNILYIKCGKDEYIFNNSPYEVQVHNKKKLKLK